jgi:hypothetical protein
MANSNLVMASSNPVTASNLATVSNQLPPRLRRAAPCPRPRQWHSPARATRLAIRTSATHKSVSAHGPAKPRTTARQERNAWHPCAFPQWAAASKHQRSSYLARARSRTDKACQIAVLRGRGPEDPKTRFSAQALPVGCILSYSRTCLPTVAWF